MVKVNGVGEGQRKVQEHWWQRVQITKGPGYWDVKTTAFSVLILYNSCSFHLFTKFKYFCNLSLFTGKTKYIFKV